MLNAMDSSLLAPKQSGSFPVKATDSLALRLVPPLPSQISVYPHLRYMGNKRRLLPWIHETLSSLRFSSASDPFCGSGCVSYLMKTMGKRVVASDFLNFPSTVAAATVENSKQKITTEELRQLKEVPFEESFSHFIEKTFSGIFYSLEDLRFLDRVSNNIQHLPNSRKRHLALAALIRSCLKRQPRGVFTVAGDPEKYKDGRRDLSLSLEQHFTEQVQAYNDAVFDNGGKNVAFRCGVFDLPKQTTDLVYLDPPYVPRSDDNCYMKRYHFLEGISCYWKDQTILHTSKVKKIEKPFTPFSYRKTAREAFKQLFSIFSDQIIVLSYSSNGYPDLDELVSIMKKFKSSIHVERMRHRYHFGTHRSAKRNVVEEYLIIGT